MLKVSASNPTQGHNRINRLARDRRVAVGSGDCGPLSHPRQTGQARSCTRRRKGATWPGAGLNSRRRRHTHALALPLPSSSVAPVRDISGQQRHALSFIESIKSAATNLATFSGRSSPPAFWRWYLLPLIASIVVERILGAVLGAMVQDGISLAGLEIWSFFVAFIFQLLLIMWTLPSTPSKIAYRSAPTAWRGVMGCRNDHPHFRVQPARSAVAGSWVSIAATPRTRLTRPAALRFRGSDDPPGRRTRCHQGPRQHLARRDR